MSGIRLVGGWSLLLVGLLHAAPLQAQASIAPQTLEDLETAIEQVRRENPTPAMAVAVVDVDGAPWFETWGRVHHADNTPVTRETLFRIGSVSKMFVALAALKLREQGVIALNDRLSRLAPELRYDNPWEQASPVRLVHLLEHTAGWDDMRFAEMALNDAAAMPLDKALSLYPATRTSRWIPGTRAAYSNVGAAVGAYIVERHAGESFEDYVRTRFFEPLGMNSATYDRPAEGGRLATGYLDGQAQPYWHLLYRPAGAINASIEDMAKFLKFMLHRGTAAGRRVLRTGSIDRMERPASGLGAGQGVTAGCGLHNCTSGWGRHGVAFHGHNGGGVGYAAEFTYSPELGGGFVILMTGDGAGKRRISDLIRAYLLRGTNPQTPASTPLPERFRHATGLYKPLNPRLQALQIVTDLTGMMRFSADPTTFHRSPLFGGWRSDDVALDERLLADPWTGLPTVAVADDPLAGEVVAVNAGNVYQKIPAWKVYGVLALGAVWLLLNAGAVIHSFFWLPGWFAGRLATGPALTLRLWPTLAGYAAGAYGLLLSRLIPRTDVDMSLIAGFGRLTWNSGALFGLSLSYAGIALVGTAAVAYAGRRAQSMRLRGYATVAMIVHLLVNGYFASYGLVGFRSWAY